MISYQQHQHAGEESSLGEEKSFFYFLMPFLVLLEWKLWDKNVKEIKKGWQWWILFFLKKSFIHTVKSLFSLGNPMWPLSPAHRVQGQCSTTSSRRGCQHRNILSAWFVRTWRITKPRSGSQDCKQFTSLYPVHYRAASVPPA